MAEAEELHVAYLTCASCLQPIAMRSGEDVVTLYHQTVDPQGRERRWHRNYHPDCAPKEARHG